MDNDPKKDAKVAHSQIQPQLIQLDGLLGHLSCSSGLYSKETFLSLYSCITRMIRDHRMKGVIFTRTLQDESFETMALALEGIPDVSLYRFSELPLSTGITEATGFIFALTDRFCAALYWSADTHETFRMYEGGWTFNPGDVRTIAIHLVSHLEKSDGTQPDLQRLLEETPTDRRYDDKLNSLTTALVNGLETRNRELIQALEQVNDLNQKVVQSERLAAVGQLCSVIAHEIRNPLGLIDLYAKLIEGQLEKVSSAAPPEQQETLLKNLQQIRQATGSLETILSELTQYSRPLELQVEAVDVVSLVRDVCEFYQPSYAEKNVLLEFPAADQEPVSLNLDAGRIRQALINLLKNALEVSSCDSQVKVIVASRKGDRSVYIKVSDQGSGVDPKVAAKLFTPYFSTKGNGTGLGLAHSRKILQAHGGTVELLSTSPEGSTFALILPKTEPT